MTDKKMTYGEAIAANKHDREVKALTFRDKIADALNTYRTQHTSGSMLVDLLSPNGNIFEGKLELELLADHIVDYLLD